MCGILLHSLQFSHPKTQTDLGKSREVREDEIKRGYNDLFTQLRYAVKWMLLNKMCAFIITKMNIFNEKIGL